MAIYKLVKDADSNVKIFRDGTQIGLYKEIADLGVTTHGWGSYRGSPTQIAFAVTYDILKNKEQALQTYGKFAEVISMAAPLEIEISSSAIISILSRTNNVS